jgi:hypothetical protein
MRGVLAGLMLLPISAAVTVESHLLIARNTVQSCSFTCA